MKKKINPNEKKIQYNAFVYLSNLSYEVLKNFFFSYYMKKN